MDTVPAHDDDGTDGFFFIWTIHNFLYCMQKTGEALESPSFTKDVMKRSSWSLELYPRGEYNPNYMAFYLKVVSIDGVRILNFANAPYRKESFKFALSIKSANGSFKKIKDLDEYQFCSGHQKDGFELFLDLNDVCKKGDGAYLENDSLTVRCRVWGESVVKCQTLARTFIGIEKITRRNLPLSNLGNNNQDRMESIRVESNSDLFKTLIVNIVWNRILFSGRKLQWEIEISTETVSNYIACDITVFKNKRNIHSFKDERWFKGSQQIQFCLLPFFILDDLRKAGDVSWDIDLIMSRGVVWSSEVSRTYYTEDTQEIKPKIDCSVPLSAVLQNVYTDGKFSDFMISTPKKDFPVHKAILCNRSEVFNANVEENRTGFVVIKDLDEDTVSKMLLFIYSNIVNDLDVETACKLYFAADRYKITDLKSKCSLFLVDNLNASNVCEVLVLADKLQDEGLKSAIQKFILNKGAGNY